MTEVAVAARRHAAAVTIVSVVRRFQVQSPDIGRRHRLVEPWEDVFTSAKMMKIWLHMIYFLDFDVSRGFLHLPNLER